MCFSIQFVYLCILCHRLFCINKLSVCYVIRYLTTCDKIVRISQEEYYSSEIVCFQFVAPPLGSANWEWIYDETNTLMAKYTIFRKDPSYEMYKGQWYKCARICGRDVTCRLTEYNVTADSCTMAVCGQDDLMLKKVAVN